MEKLLTKLYGSDWKVIDSLEFYNKIECALQEEFNDAESDEECHSEVLKSDSVFIV